MHGPVCEVQGGEGDFASRVFLELSKVTHGGGVVGYTGQDVLAGAGVHGRLGSLDGASRCRV